MERASGKSTDRFSRERGRKFLPRFHRGDVRRGCLHRSASSDRRFQPVAERFFGYSLAEVQERKVKMLMAAPYASEHDRY